MANSHDDRDALAGLAGELLRDRVPFVSTPESLTRQLNERAAEMSDARLNEITAGKMGEEVLHDETVGRVSVRRLPDDDLGLLRISVGGGEKVDGYYLVYRGDPAEVRKALRHAMRAMDRSTA